MSTIKAVLYKPRKKKDGTIPIYFRITRQGRASFISTGHTIAPTKWDAGLGRAKNSYKDAEALNEYLDKKTKEFAGAEKKLLYASENVSAREVIVKSEFDELSDVFSFCAHHIQKFNNPRQASTFRRYETHMDKLEQFITKKRGKRRTDPNRPPKLNFREIDLPFMNQFKKYLVDLGLQSNTRWAVFKNIKALFNGASAEGVRPADVVFPKKFDMEGEETEGESLTADEILKLANVKLEPNSLEFHARATFLCQFLMQGIRVGDCLSIKYSELSDDLTVIEHRIRKTENTKTKRREKPTLRMILPPQVVAIFRMYKELNDAKTKPSRYVFPHIADVNDVDLPKAISAATAKTNEALKRVCTKAEIKVVSTHAARRSYTTITTQSKGMAVAQQLLMHSKVEMTQRYYTRMQLDKLSAENADIGSFIPSIV